MDNLEYVAAAMRTDVKDYQPVIDRLNNKQVLRLLHAGMGASTECGEVLTALKAYIFYGKKIDFGNILEEGGDLFWFLALLFDAGGFSFETAMKANIAKLRARYPTQFTEESALNRDLEAERRELELEQDRIKTDTLL